MSTLKTNSVILGQSATENHNFLLDTDAAGALRIRRRSDGSGGLVMSINSSGIPLDKDGFDMRPLGVGQTWQTVTRTMGTVYTNNTGRTIKVAVRCDNIASMVVGIYVNGLLLQDNGVTSLNFIWLQADVPPGNTYNVSLLGGSGSIGYARELRT